MGKVFLSIVNNFQTVKMSFVSVLATVGGFVASFLGGVDKLLMTLITMIVIDYITGVIRAIFQKKVSSAVGFKGIMKKMLTLLMVGLSVTLQNVLPSGIPLREITMLFFIANEGFSILENTADIIPLPEKLRSVLSQIQQKTDSENIKTDDNPSEDVNTNNEP